MIKLHLYQIMQFLRQDLEMIQVLEWLKTIQDIRREIPVYLDPIYRPPPKPTEIPLQEVPRNLLDLDPEINTAFKEDSPFKEGVISETYQRPDK